MKKSILLATVALAIASYGTVSVAQESDAPPPPPPPPPPAEAKAQAGSKATKIHNYANDVVKLHAAYEKALQAAIADPKNESKQKAVDTAVSSLATAIDTLMRNTKSLENDVKKIMKQEEGFLQEEKREVKTSYSGKRKKSEIDLIKELEDRLKKRRVD